MLAGTSNIVQPGVRLRLQIAAFKAGGILPPVRIWHRGFSQLCCPESFFSPIAGLKLDRFAPVFFSACRKKHLFPELRYNFSKKSHSKFFGKGPGFGDLGIWKVGACLPEKGCNLPAPRFKYNGLPAVFVLSAEQLRSRLALSHRGSVPFYVRLLT